MPYSLAIISAPWNWRRRLVVRACKHGGIGNPPTVMFDPSGTRVIISRPQARTRSSMPAPIMPRGERRRLLAWSRTG